MGTPGMRDLLRGIHVLVIGEDDGAREVLSATLRYCGAAVSLAASAPEALQALQRILPDAIVSDLSTAGEAATGA